MTSIIEELMADQDPRTACRLCTWIESRPKAEQAEWDRALNEKIGPKFRFTHSSVFRALKRRQADVRQGSIENHRRNGHRTS